LWRTVAAPSANLVGHVSPATVEHVQADLCHIESLLIVSGGNATIGIEWTVVRIKNDSITILRPGFVTAGQLEEVAKTTPRIDDERAMKY
jgi:L-threonylcarbamoyladenylate synthase